LEKKQQQWYSKIIGHNVHGEAWKLHHNDYSVRSKKMREENEARR